MIPTRFAACLLLVTLFFGTIAAAEPSLAADGATNLATSERAGERPAAPRTRFVRVMTDADGNETALEVSIVGYRPASDAGGVRVDLVSAVHVADRAYYQALNRRFRDYDSVLYELIVVEQADRPAARTGAGDNGDGGAGGDEDRTLISSTQVAMKNALGLAFQLEEIDYTAGNLIHADLTRSELRQSMTERDESLYVYFWRSSDRVRSAWIRLPAV